MEKEIEPIFLYNRAIRDWGEPKFLIGDIGRSDVGYTKVLSRPERDSTFVETNTYQVSVDVVKFYAEILSHDPSLFPPENKSPVNGTVLAGFFTYAKCGSLEDFPDVKMPGGAHLIQYLVRENQNGGLHKAIFGDGNNIDERVEQIILGYQNQASEDRRQQVEMRSYLRTMTPPPRSGLHFRGGAC